MAVRTNPALAPRTRIRHKTITASVADELREQIISGQIKGGDPLRQELLAEEFGCSLIPVREALLNLKGEGLVEFISHKGAIAKDVTITEVDEIFALRAMLESDILSRAMARIGEEEIARSEAILGEFETLLEPGSDLQAWGRLNWDYHSTHYLPAHRNYTFQMIERLHTNCDRYIRLQLQLDESRPLAHAEHLEILDRIRARDKRGAVKALREHVLVTGKRLITSLKALGSVRHS